MQLKARAIIIDDDASCRALLKLLLENKGIEVICLDEPTACPLYNDAQCTCPLEYACGDFLLTDNRMPRMTGIDFVEHQEKRSCKGIVANKAVFSGSWSEEELARAKRLGCRVFHKPFNLKEISLWLDERIKHIDPKRKLVEFSDNHYSRTSNTDAE